MFGWFKKTDKWAVQPASELSAGLGPQPGETWCFDDGSPWPTSIRVKVIDARDGWVRYSMGVYFCDERKKTHQFMSLYRKVDA